MFHNSAKIGFDKLDDASWGQLIDSSENDATSQDKLCRYLPSKVEAVNISAWILAPEVAFPMILEIKLRLQTNVLWTSKIQNKKEMAEKKENVMRCVSIRDYEWNLAFTGLGTLFSHSFLTFEMSSGSSITATPGRLAALYHEKLFLSLWLMVYGLFLGRIS